nr:ATP-dependent DNA ligase [Nitrososphaeria archaeon]NIN53056.1 ATP-dependent DNA ligase [Nitrososphaeria archaeon]NIQ33641.1 ATP-dependent DNA ligase [Nitrososphaeria archaeon]
EEDKEILTGMIMGELRVGAVEGLILGGIAKASNISLKEVREAYMLSGEMGKIARIAIHKGREEVRSIKIEPFNPLRPMLATSVDTLEEAFGTRDNVAVEVKYDGARVQIHLRDGTVKIFSRRLTEVTKSLPDVVEMVKSKVYTQEAVLEGEVVGIDSRGKPLPFQYLMRRFRRILRIEEAVKKIPIELHLFDILYINGEMLIHKPYSERYLTLEKVADIQVLTERLVTEDIREAKALYQRAIEMGHEGVMVKNLESPYILGRRGKHWLKVKKVGTLDLVIIGADWGHGRRRGWLSDYYLSAYRPDTDEFEIIGKTFKGLTDQEFRSITQQLLSLKTYEKDYTVWVRPQIVVEVAFNEIQKSPTYPCGYALRLARIVRFREDKTPSEADSIQKVAELYEKQFKYKGKAEF